MLFFAALSLIGHLITWVCAKRSEDLIEGTNFKRLLNNLKLNTPLRYLELINLSSLYFCCYFIKYSSISQTSAVMTIELFLTFTYIGALFLLPLVLQYRNPRRRSRFLELSALFLKNFITVMCLINLRNFNKF